MTTPHLRHARFAGALFVCMCLASAPAASPGRAAEGDDLRPDAAWSEARTLSDAGRYDEALRLLEAALAASPDDTGLLWLQAGITGWAGRHGESGALYERLVASHPEMADDLRVDLARQRLYAGDTQAALSELTLHLMRHPTDRTALLLRAEALTYAQRFDDAEVVYRELLRAEPADPGARRGLARTLNWRGQHREAARIYAQLYDEGERDPEVVDGLAHARYWSGRSDLAYRSMDDLLRAKPGDRSAERLAQDVAWERGPSLSADYDRAIDSDALDLRTARFDYRQPASHSDLLHATWSVHRAQDPSRYYRMERAGLGYERLWSDSWETHALLEYQYKGPTDAKHLLGDAYATFRPNDDWRFDFGVGHEQVFAGGALDQDIRTWVGSVGADWRVNRRFALSGAVRGLSYSDDNTGLRTSLLAQYQTDADPLDVSMFLGFEQFAVSEPENGNGYYAPAGYFELTPGVEMTYRHRSGFLAGGEVRFGVQKEQGADADPMTAASARLELPVLRYLLLGARASYNDSNLALASGYSRDQWGLYLRTRF